jgi:hypothetical protein
LFANVSPRDRQADPIAILGIENKAIAARHFSKRVIAIARSISK